MPTRKYQITKQGFLAWLISDVDDVKYWGDRFIKDLKTDNKIAVTVHELFHERETLPGWLFRNQVENEEELYEDIPIKDIDLI